MSSPRLLVLTQSVDLDDPVLGFFHGWLRAFSGAFPRIQVVCLREGRHDLPENVVVHSLGKERRISRIGYVLNFYHLIWSLRGEYDAVFVHMNAEYVVLGGLLWRFLGKHLILWRNHAAGGVVTRLSIPLVHTVCYTSPSAFVARYRRAVRMPVGVDTAQFALPRTAKQGSILSLGRIDPVKNVHVLLDAISILDGGFSLDVYGRPSEGSESYAKSIRCKHETLEKSGRATFHGHVLYEDIPALYASHDIFINLTQAGSFDKTLFEAMAAGCLVVTSNVDLRSVVREGLFVEHEEADAVASALRRATALSECEKDEERAKLRAYAAEHSLDRTVRRCAQILYA